MLVFGWQGAWVADIQGILLDAIAFEWPNGCHRAST